MRKFKKPNYKATLQETIRIEDVVGSNHLARFVVDVISELDLSKIYAGYADKGGAPIAPEILLGLLFYGYATGLFSSRKIEKATYERIPFRFVAGGLHPDHSTIATFRKAFLGELQDLFVQILLLAQVAGIFQLGDISLDGSKIHADASKSKAVSYKRLGKLEAKFQQEVKELFDLGEEADQNGLTLPDGLIIEDEIKLRQQRLENLSVARAVLEARAQERYDLEMAEYEAKMREREERTRKTGKKTGGKKPKPPEPGPRDKDQYNFTDPESRIMKNSTDQGFDQHYNVQIAVDHDAFLIVAPSISNHPNDKKEAEPTLDAISPKLGKPASAALDNGYFSETTISALEKRSVEPYIATGREAHHKSWRTFFKELSAPPPEDASPTIKMAYKLQTEIGQAIYRLRKCTVEPVFGIIKEIMGFRQFSLRGLEAVRGEWFLVCLAFNLKRMHTMMVA